MANEIKVRVGREMPESERSKVDRSKMAVLHPQPPKHKVEGQYPVHVAVQCPNCGAIGYTWIEHDQYTSVYCGYCGTYFYA